MELINPWVLYILIPSVLVLIIICFIKFKNKEKFDKGVKVAEADYITKTPFYKSILTEFKILKVLIFVVLILAISVSFLLLTRPAERQTIEPEVNNRDIFLCMDVSDSMDELNLEICEQLIDIVKNLNGERFGITIFNARSVLLVPLTTDYDYVIDTLEDLKKAFQYSCNKSYDFLFGLSGDFDYEVAYYKYEGTLCDYGSSFIGDGLASTLYNFSDLKENPDRTRLIIFTTDNQLNGVPTVSIEEAASYCAKNNVKVYSLVPTTIENEASFKPAMEATGGGYYKSDDKKIVNKMLEDIKKTNLSVMKDVKTIYMDKPDALVIILLILTCIYIILCKRIKL